MGYKVGYRFNNQEKLCFNAQVFESREDAISAGDELMSRWTLPIGFEVVHSNNAVNYRVVNGKPKRYVICDNCTEDNAYKRECSGCRANETTCKDGRNCPDFIEQCDCLECHPFDEEHNRYYAPEVY